MRLRGDREEQNLNIAIKDYTRSPNHTTSSRIKHFFPIKKAKSSQIARREREIAKDSERERDKSVKEIDESKNFKVIIVFDIEALVIRK